MADRLDTLCNRCTHVREIVTPKRSRFLLCRLSQYHPGFVKYPPQPIRQCSGFGEKRTQGEAES